MSVGRRTSRLLVWALLGAALVLPASADAAFPGANGKIAFTAGADSQIFVMNPDGSGVVQLTNSPGRNSFPAWSPDGRKIAFSSTRDDPDPAGCSPCNVEIYTMDADGANVTRLTNTPSVRESAPAWSPDGTKIAFFHRSPDSSNFEIYVMNADGTGVTQLTSGLGNKTDPAWSPDGSRIAFHRQDIWSMNPDGTDQINLTANEQGVGGREPDWSPDATTIAYERDPCAITDDDCWSQRSALTRVRTMRRDGTGQFEFPGYNNSPAWSPDRSRLVMGHAVSCSGVHVTCVTRLMTVNPDGSDATVLDIAGSDPSWQPIPYTGYARPKTASPVDVPLVPAYRQCTTANRTHGPPLAFASCHPPVGESSSLTVGTPDSNGAAPRSIGAVKFQVLFGDPATAADEADVRIRLEITDVRNRADLSDYTGEVQVGLWLLRITDRDNAPAPGGGSDPATTVDIPMPPTATCAATADPGVGGTCALLSTLDAFVPGMVKERQRAIWEFGAIQVFDGGADGDAQTDPNTPFMRQGLFVP